MTGKTEVSRKNDPIQASCRSLRPHSCRRGAGLYTAAIFGYKKNDGLQDSARVNCPCGEGRDG